MKKLLLVVAIAVTGLMCAKNEGSHAQMKNYRENEITFNEVTLFDRSGTLENDLLLNHKSAEFL